MREDFRPSELDVIGSLSFERLLGAHRAFSVIALLAGNVVQPMPLRDLQAASGMDFTNFDDAIKRLQELHYITLSGGPSSESAQLTEFGTEIASLARTA